MRFSKLDEIMFMNFPFQMPKMPISNAVLNLNQVLIAMLNTSMVNGDMEYLFLYNTQRGGEEEIESKDP